MFSSRQAGVVCYYRPLLPALSSALACGKIVRGIL